jgi:hypothetical protein
VLGLSITPAAARLVVVEGAAGEGDTVRHDAIDIDTLRACTGDGAHGLAELLLGKPLASQPRSIGVSWTDTAAADGSRVLHALAVAGFDNFIAVSESDAAAALASALLDLAGSEDIAVCIVEPEAAVVATVRSGIPLAERIARPDNSIDDLVGSLAALLHPREWTPDATFALGAGRNPVVNCLGRRSRRRVGPRHRTGGGVGNFRLRSAARRVRRSPPPA